jgi:ribosomal protein S14
MTNQLEKDKSRRQLYKKQELKRIGYKSTIQDLCLPTKTRIQFIQRLNTLNRNSSIARVKNRCVLSGRARGVYRFCRLSRISLRDLASQGLLMGVAKSSW